MGSRRGGRTALGLIRGGLPFDAIGRGGAAGEKIKTRNLELSTLRRTRRHGR